MPESSLKLVWQERSCPMCGGNKEARVVLESNVDPSKLNAYAFASRKLPEYMHSRMVECADCGLVYGTPAVSSDCMAEAYGAAAYDSGLESQFASQTYAKLISPTLSSLPSHDKALDIGTGDGSFVEQLLGLGFRHVTGVELSSAPLAAAKPEIRSMIRHGIFRREEFQNQRFDLITCFQILEHVPNPAELLHDVFALLKPGGLFVSVAHNLNALSARLLGQKSPIYDIEHLQLFSETTIIELLSRSGFMRTSVTSVWNHYPISYWLRLFPIPPGLKRTTLSAAGNIGLGNIVVPLPAGNMAAFGWKPMDAP